MFSILEWGIYFSSLYFAVFWLLVLIEKGGEIDSDISNSDTVKDEYLPVVSIIVPAYNEEIMIEQSINSLLNLDYPKDKLEIIVVDDGSTDNTKEICEKFLWRIKLINLIKNSGAKAIPLNIGLEHAKGEIIACLDADSVVEKDALRKMIPYFSDKEVAAVTPALKVWNPRNLLQKLQWFEYIFAIFLRKLMALINCIYVTPGPFTLYRRSILLIVNGFDKDNITEDMEIALRLQSHHYRIENAINANVYTLAPSDLRDIYAQRRRWYGGLMYNSMKYKNLFFNRSYGDFGIMMPLHVFSAIVLMLSTFLFGYYLFNPLFHRLSKLFFINFDIITLLKGWSFDIVLLDIDAMKFFVMGVLLILGIISLLLAHRFSNERIMKHGISSAIVFVLFYFLFLGGIWIGVITELIRGVRKVW